MSLITDTWRQLVRRRLWPVAVLLLAALVAVPLVLSEEPAPPADGPALPVGTQAADGPGDPVVTLATAERRAERRRVLGSPKDPFAPPSAPRLRAPRGSASADDGTAPVRVEPLAPSPSPPFSGGGSAPTPGGPPMPDRLPTPAPGGDATPTEPQELYSLTVRFGDATAEELEKRELPRLRPLPSLEDPILVYLGVSEDGKRAVFLLDQGVVAQGDGVCGPTPTTCETIELAPGETEFLDVPGPDGEVAQQYQLDVVKIHRTRTRDAEVASAARTRESAAGRVLLSERIADDGPLRFAYDPETGTLEELSRDEYGAAVAQAERARAARRGGPRVRRARPR